jgi:hypothetical protein
VQTGLGTNNTKTLYSPATGTPNVAHRINDGTFSFGTLAGTETALILQGDFRYHDNFSGAGDFYIMLHNAGAPSPQIGLGPIGITLRDAGYGATATFMPATIQVGDWVRLRMELDLTANGGNGSADVYYQNLTDGDAGLVPIASLQNIDTNIVGAGSLPTAWNTMRIDGRSGGPGIGGFDNFTVIVPEPSSAMLLLLTASFLLARRRQERDAGNR